MLQPDKKNDQAEDYEKVLKKDIGVPQKVADTFRKTRGGLVAQAKGQVRSSHLRAMSQTKLHPMLGLALGTHPSVRSTGQ